LHSEGNGATPTTVRHDTQEPHGPHLMEKEKEKENKQ
jgi:hypothetical protein